jgi:hypothetical protein
MWNDLPPVGGVAPQGQQPARPTESPPEKQKGETRPAAGRLEGRRRLENDTLEISQLARKQLEAAREAREKGEKLEGSDLEFTGQRFYTLGLNIIRKEEIKPPSEPEIKP